VLVILRACEVIRSIGVPPVFLSEKPQPRRLCYEKLTSSERSEAPPERAFQARPQEVNRMATVSLPLFQPRPASTGKDAVPAVDRSKPYPSCQWLEEGIAFNRRSLNACLIVHHNRGFPYLCDFNGGEIDMGAVLAAKARIIAENQGAGHEACRGCPHLVTKKWRQPRYPIGVMGIAQFAHCNIECSYCFLQTQDPSSFAAGLDPYEVFPPIRNLVVDWGGGEPTIYREFDDVLAFVTRLGATTWVHTNGTRLPAPIRNGLPTRRINILCSVDAGTRETWKLIKRRDLLDTVWRNLEQYIRLGCQVVLKYIVKEENCTPDELSAFVSRAVSIGATQLILDIDYDHPDPSPAVMDGLRTLRRLATVSGLHTTFGATGSLFTPEIDVAGRLASQASRRTDRIVYGLRRRVSSLTARARLIVRILRHR
jgi:hypothetical protein